METALFSLKLTIGPVCVCATKKKLSQLENVELLNLKIKQPLCVAPKRGLACVAANGASGRCACDSVGQWNERMRNIRKATCTISL